MKHKNTDLKSSKLRRDRDVAPETDPNRRAERERELRDRSFCYEDRGVSTRRSTIFGRGERLECASVTGTVKRLGVL